MKHNQLIEYYSDHSFNDFLRDFNDSETTDQIHLKNLSASSGSVIASVFIQNSSCIHLFITQEKEEAAYLYNDLKQLLQETIPLFFYPSATKYASRHQENDHENIVLRTEVLNSLSNYINKEKSNSIAIVTYPEALIEKVVSKSKLKKNTLRLHVKEKISQEFLSEVLHEYKFEKVDFVYEPGQYSIRGSIVDVFSYSYDMPFRIDFFGDEVESIRTFNLDDQLSLDPFDSINIVPNLQDQEIEITRETFLDYLPSNSILWFRNRSFIITQMDVLYKRMPEVGETGIYAGIEKDHFITTGQNILQISQSYKNIEYSNASVSDIDKSFRFNTSPQPSFKKNFEILIKDLTEKQKEGYEINIITDNQQQVERLKNVFETLNAEILFKTIPCVIHEGFIDHDLKKCIYTDHQVFDRYHKYNIPNKFSKKEKLTLREFNELKPGDFIVHIDHGIGQFGGLEKININGKMQETIRLVYKDRDILYVSIHNLHKISKYKGKEGSSPKIYKLGGGAWQKLKQTTKNKVKDIARDLISLYAKRKMQKGFAFSPDSYLQNELEASFFFEDTPDQTKATKIVKDQMEKVSPMDILICGDVGFGKTEVAIRAAFKAVTDNKQVAVLVPTTILALQHYQTFRERLKDFPCKIEYINRHKTRKEQNQILEELVNGKTDVLIGTHRLIGKDVKFKDLGLLIIDEEQKFGVSVKEKLRQLKQNVDTLTMTATPIPRTLQFSMMGARDLAIINTPPPNRYPIITEIHPFHDQIIKEGIEYEVARGGQVFFIHNRVQNIEEVQKMILKLCPKVQTVVAHGQMDGKKLEEIMLQFISGDFDVLIATTIIESGLDIPNANTIFINNAQNFGLSDLHQLRGRVGRSNKKAFCYLLAPPAITLTQEARRRLTAIEEFSELGSGFNIAMQDLDIRGAGNLLGAEQSGFIADIGFETYHQILDEAIQELKEQEFREVLTSESDKPKEQKLTSFGYKYVKDCQIDTDLEILFPESYISNISERIRLYRELDTLNNDEELDVFQRKLIDRFGEIPKPTIELINIVKLRRVAMSLGLEMIVLKNSKMVAHFISDQQSKYYQSKLFVEVLQYIQNHPRKFKMKQGEKRLSLIVENIKSVEEAIALLNQMKPSYELSH